MSATQVFPRATRIVPLLCAPVLALSALAPAAAQLPRLPPVIITAPAPVQLDTGIQSSPLTLLSNHVDVRVIGAAARVRTTLTWRNDGVQPVRAQLPVPLPSALATVRQAFVDAADGCSDDPDPLNALVASLDAGEEPVDPALLDPEFLEAGERAAARGHSEVVLVPGEEVTVVVERDTELLTRGDRHRLVLPLLTQRHGMFTPQFSAAVWIDAARPIVELGSATHAGEISGIGDTRAQLLVPNGRVHEGQFLAIDFALGGEIAPPPSVAADDGRRWGGEARSRTLVASR